MSLSHGSLGLVPAFGCFTPSSGDTATQQVSALGWDRASCDTSHTHAHTHTCTHLSDRSARTVTAGPAPSQPRTSPASQRRLPPVPLRQATLLRGAHGPCGAAASRFAHRLYAIKEGGELVSAGCRPTTVCLPRGGRPVRGAAVHSGAHGLAVCPVCCCGRGRRAGGAGRAAEAGRESGGSSRPRLGGLCRLKAVGRSRTDEVELPAQGGAPLVLVTATLW